MIHDQQNIYKFEFFCPGVEEHRFSSESPGIIYNLIDAWRDDSFKLPRRGIPRVLGMFALSAFRSLEGGDQGAAIAITSSDNGYATITLQTSPGVFLNEYFLRDAAANSIRLLESVAA